MNLERFIFSKTDVDLFQRQKMIYFVKSLKILKTVNFPCSHLNHSVGNSFGSLPLSDQPATRGGLQFVPFANVISKSLLFCKQPRTALRFLAFHRASSRTRRCNWVHHLHTPGKFGLACSSPARLAERKI